MNEIKTTQYTAVDLHTDEDHELCQTSNNVCVNVCVRIDSEAKWETN